MNDALLRTLSDFHCAWSTGLLELEAMSLKVECGFTPHCAAFTGARYLVRKKKQLEALTDYLLTRLKNWFSGVP
jgi:hypothetical protein